MATSLLTLTGIHLRFGSEPLLEGADLNVVEGDRICLVGRNGSGKSTLLRIAAGMIQADRGERFQHPGASIRYLAQEADLGGYDTALAYVEAGLGPTDDPYRARYLLNELGLIGDEHPSRLSGGETRRTALARVLAPAPDVLLLDEPTNHLDITAIEWLETHLRGIRSGLVLISHDRRFLETLSRTTVWLDRGVARRQEQGFAHFETWRDDTLEQEEAERHKLDRKIVRENEWMYSGGVTGRRKRNMRRVRELAAMRQEKREQRQAVGSVRLEASEGGLSSRLIVEAKGLAKSYDDRPIVRDVTTRILRGDRVGVIGPNGAGKTTLLALLSGTLEPDAGEARRGENLLMVTLDQGRDGLDPTWTLAEALTGGRGDRVVVNGETRHVVSYMKDFLFAAEQARSPLRVLSGGERGRLMLARALAKPSNVLVLDEPTNDLDMETLDLLQELLAAYAGTVLLVSHDRDFLDRVVTSVIASDGDGRWVEYAGGYSDMLMQRRGAAAAAVAQAKTARATAAEPSTRPASSFAPPSVIKGRKLSFKEKHRLETLPGVMAGLEREVAAARARMAEPDLYARDRALFDRTTAALGEAERHLAAAEEEWLALELLREAAEG